MSSDATTQVEGPKHNGRMAMWLALIVAGMVGMAFAAVPLYSIFCSTTGYGGTTKRAAGNPKGVIAREMTTRFDATISSGLPIVVKPSKPVTDPIGKAQTIVFHATNPTAREIDTTASFNVTPDQAGAYFNKIECFCFTEQKLKPGETVDMPVTFFIDPDLAKDKDLDTVKEITLSYTFYASNNGES